MKTYCATLYIDSDPFRRLRVARRVVCADNLTHAVGITLHEMQTELDVGKQTWADELFTAVLSHPYASDKELQQEPCVYRMFLLIKLA